MALPESEIQPVPSCGIRMPDFWWEQMLNLNTYQEISKGYGRKVADRYIELGMEGADNSTIVRTLRREFNMPEKNFWSKLLDIFSWDS